MRLGRALFNAQAQQHGRPTQEHWRRVVVSHLVSGFSDRLASNPARASARLAVPVHMRKPLWWCCTPACTLQRPYIALLSPFASQLTEVGLLSAAAGCVQEAIAQSEGQRAAHSSRCNITKSK